MSQKDFFTELGQNSAESAPDMGKRRLRRTARAQRAAARRRRRRRIVSTIVILIVLALVGFVAYKALGVVQEARSSATAVTDYSGVGGEEVIVSIPDGSTGTDIGTILKDAGVVATVKAFTDAYSANSHATNIQGGTYTLRKEMSAANAVAALLDPASRADHTLTIPEGYTKTQVKDRLISIAGFSEEEVDAAFADAAGIGLPDSAAGEVEGWLSPGTYDVPENATATDVVGAMVSQTLSNLQSLGVAEADYKTVLTKASIVEREVSNASYYGMVARVIENRLADVDGETKGYLQMDSTVLYGLGRSGGIPTSAEINDASNVYNTYQHAGLPPTPIASPGKEAIAAVINPPAGQWLYFVTIDLETGETLFASTKAEQDANTEKLTTYCKNNPDICSGSSQ